MNNKNNSDPNELTDDLLMGILESVTTIALVGASAKPSRPSNSVMRFLLDRGYKVHPINPGLEGQEIHGHKVLASLDDVPTPCDMVDIFRNSDDAGEICRNAVELADEKGFQVVWMQLGVENQAAAAVAREAGLVVVQNRCPKIEIERLKL